MKLICIAVDPSVVLYPELIGDLVAVVEKHGGRGLSTGSIVPLEEIGTGARYRLNDLARACRISVTQVDVYEP